jgi:YggT family protein
MQSVLWLLLQIINIYIYILVVWVVLSWLVAFDVINLRNRFVRMIHDVLNRLTDPVMRPIRRILPNLGGLDLSPLIVFFLLMFIQRLLLEYWPHPTLQ